MDIYIYVDTSYCLGERSTGQQNVDNSVDNSENSYAEQLTLTTVVLRDGLA